MSLIVAISTVKDQNMYNRHDPLDEAVIENRQRFLHNNSIDINQTTRVREDYDRTDYCEFVIADDTIKGKGMQDNGVVAADALITTDPNHALFLAIADCIGAAVFDPTHNVLALAHLGRHSLEQSGAHKLINHLEKYYGSHPEEIQIWLTPAPGKDVYPIWALDNKGMKEVTFEQFKAAGILEENIVDNPAESDKDTNYYSYSEFLKGNRDEDADYAIVTMMTDENLEQSAVLNQFDHIG